MPLTTEDLILRKLDRIEAQLDEHIQIISNAKERLAAVETLNNRLATSEAKLEVLSTSHWKLIGSSALISVLLSAIAHSLFAITK